MKDHEWREINRLVEVLMEPKESWREKIANSSVKNLVTFISNFRAYWIGKEDCGVFGNLLKERSLEFVEIAEAELITRDKDN